MSDDPAHETDTQEEKLRQLHDEFMYETDEEIKRKRDVYRAHIVNETSEEIAKSQKDLDSNRKAYDVLSKIIQTRERKRNQRELRKDILQWLGFIGPFILGVITSHFWR